MALRIAQNPAPQLSRHPKGDEVLSDGCVCFLITLSVVSSCKFVRYIYYVCIYLFLLFRPTRNKTIAARDRLTIYFHAVLSNDFKFDPKEDHIFIRAGSRIGAWKENAVELFVTRYLFLNELSVKLRWWLS